MRPSAFLATLGAVGAHALSTDEWRKQSIYQVLTDRFARPDGSTTACTNLRSYCGGTWQGLINKLDYIQNMGFTAVWISPIVKNIEDDTIYGPAYHGYWAQDIYSLNPHFGTEDDLKQLASALHSRGMYLMVDVVTNHVASNTPPDQVDYSIYRPFNTSDKYHPYCPINYNDPNSVIKCWSGDTVVPLPDIRTEDSDVRAIYNSWIKDLVATYSIDGLRIDSLLEVEKEFWPGFQAAAGCYLVGEAFNGDPSVFPDWLNYISGTLNYPTYYSITNAFKSTTGSMSDLVNMINVMKGQMETNTLGGFLENHDNTRFPSLTPDIALAKNAIAFTLLMDGIPIIYQGQEQHFSGDVDPNNRQALWISDYATNNDLYPWIRKVNQIRSQAIAADAGYVAFQALPVSPDARTIALRKGLAGAQIVGAYTNIGAGGTTYPVSLPGSFTGFVAGQLLTDVMSCETTVADSTGTLSFTQGPETRVWFPTDKLGNSGICANVTGGGSNCATVQVTFDEIVTTVIGQTIKIVGSVPELGSWAPGSAVTLNASQYTNANHLWQTTIKLKPGESVQYKFISVASDGTVTWESDPNRSFTVPSTCAGVTMSGAWR